MKIFSGLYGAAVCLGLLAASTPAHADKALPAYACAITSAHADGTLTGTRCEAKNGAPATGRITKTFAVWSPLTVLYTCTGGRAYTPDRITATGCTRLL
ncbi:hypothetical protein [Nonomuraea longicatena]|uniref:Uncharacterized protein n=1 Tax=Nonomuraea longicatena TaxID=83682 RepID=A0ABP3Z3A6_9ACTN